MKNYILILTFLSGFSLFGQTKSVNINKTKTDIDRLKNMPSKNTVTPEFYGAKGNGINNDYKAIQTAFNSGRNVILSKLYYIGDSTVSLSSSNITILGENRGGLKGTNDILVSVSGSISNVSFKAVTFEGSGSKGSYFGLFTSVDKEINGLTFDKCNFTATSISNGIKIINEHTEKCQNVTFKGCTFYDIGQMGIEFQNHNFDGVYRYSNINILNCQFRNLGLKSKYGMAISFSGHGNNIVVTDNKITGAKDIGIELAIGQKDVLISNNTLDNLKGGCAPFSFSNGTNEWDHINITVTGNESKSDGRVNFYRLTNSNVKNNKFTFTGSNGYMQMTNGNNTMISGNFIQTDGPFGLFCNHTKGKSFSNNTITNNNIVAHAVNATDIQLDGEMNINNKVYNNKLQKGAKGNFVSLTNNAKSEVTLQPDKSGR